MAVRCLVGGELISFDEAQVEFVNGSSITLWRGMLKSDWFYPYLPVVSTTPIPKTKGLVLCLGNLEILNGQKVVLQLDSLYWGTKFNYVIASAKVLEVYEKGELYLCQSDGLKFLFYQENGRLLRPGEKHFLEGSLQVEREPKGERLFWKVKITGKPIDL